MDIPATHSAPPLDAWLLLLVGLSLAPFALTMMTSFIKLVVVGSIIRTALGTPQIPPTIVITGLAMILSAHVMWPVGRQISANYRERTQRHDVTGPPSEVKDGSAFSSHALGDIVHSAQGPMRTFLDQHSDPKNKALFRGLRERVALKSVKSQPTVIDRQPESHTPDEHGMVDDITVLVPAFVLTELTEAFQIGFLIFIPFLIIDLVVSNVLMAVGMQYLQPTVVSLPLKLLLFVLMDGWRIILEGVILGYA